jgi:hypothetical protein
MLWNYAVRNYEHVYIRKHYVFKHDSFLIRKIIGSYELVVAVRKYIQGVW